MSRGPKHSHTKRVKQCQSGVLQTFGVYSAAKTTRRIPCDFIIFTQLPRRLRRLRRLRPTKNVASRYVATVESRLGKVEH